MCYKTLNHMAKTEILVVDDERTVREGLEAILGREGYGVRTARDGEAGIAEFAARRPGLVLLDLMMPGLDGFGVCERLRRLDRETPIIILTAKDSDADQVRGLEVGADDFVSKRTDEAVLLIRIRKALERAARFGGLPAPANLTKTEADLYRLLRSAQGRPFTYREIYDAIRGRGYVGSESAIRAHVSYLRGKLGAEGRRLVAIRRRGYMYAEEGETTTMDKGRSAFS